MELKVGKTFYKTNEYLINNSSLINSSNYTYLTNKYNYKKIDSLEDFNKHDDLFIIKTEIENKFKRPKLIIFNNTLYMRDDLFFKFNLQMKKDPVLDYNTLVKLENEIENNCLNKLYASLNNVDYNKFMNVYQNKKNSGDIEIDLNHNIIKFDYINEEVKLKRNILKNA